MFEAITTNPKQIDVQIVVLSHTYFILFYIG